MLMQERIVVKDAWIEVCTTEACSTLCASWLHRLCEAPRIVWRANNTLREAFVATESDAFATVPPANLCAIN